MDTKFLFLSWDQVTPGQYHMMLRALKDCREGEETQRDFETFRKDF